MSRPWESVRPVFLGGPLHGDPVPHQFHAEGTDVMAVEPQEIRSTVPASFSFTRVRYVPQRFTLNSPFWGMFEIKIWVDSRLCERARDRLMLRLINELGWIDRMQHPFSVPPTPATPIPQETPDAQEQRSEEDRP